MVNQHLYDTYVYRYDTRCERLQLYVISEVDAYNEEMQYVYIIIINKKN